MKLSREIIIGAICLFVGFTLAYFWLDRRPAESNEGMYKKIILEKDSTINSLEAYIDTMQTRREVVVEKVKEVQYKYIPVYGKINHANRHDLDVAFDSLLTD